jgi:hypothetical protein
LVGDHTGVTDGDEFDTWLTGADRDYILQGSDLLRRGRGGLRVGNLASIKALTGQSVSPVHRVVEPSKVVLPYCVDDFAVRKGAALLDVGMFKAFVSGLFPVGQGVYESGSTAYCLRYLIE